MNAIPYQFLYSHLTILKSHYGDDDDFHHHKQSYRPKKKQAKKQKPNPSKTPKNHQKNKKKKNTFSSFLRQTTTTITTINDWDNMTLQEDEIEILRSIQVLHPSRYYSSGSSSSSSNSISSSSCNMNNTSTTTATATTTTTASSSSSNGTNCNHRNSHLRSSKQRFSSLLLEYGEQELYDWAVVASSNSNNAPHHLPDRRNGNNDSYHRSSSRRSTNSSSSNGSRSTYSQSNRNQNTTSSTNTGSRSSSENNHEHTKNAWTSKSIFRAHNHLNLFSSSISPNHHSNKNHDGTSSTTETNHTNTTTSASPTVKLQMTTATTSSSSAAAASTRKFKKHTSKKRFHRSNHHNHHSSTNNSNMEKAEGTNSMKRIQGRLYLCTKSIVFEPNDLSRGIIRFPFDKMTTKPFLNPHQQHQHQHSDGIHGSRSNNLNDGRGGMYNQHNHPNHPNGNTSSTISFTTMKYIIMKKNNIIKPYTVIDHTFPHTMSNHHRLDLSSSSSSMTTQTTQPQQTSTSFSFTFLFSKPTQFLNICHTLSENPNLVSLNSRLSFANHNNHNNQNNHNNHYPTNSVKFNIHNLNHLTEIPKTTALSSYILEPLMSKAGCTMITDQYLYFQPMHGIMGMNLPLNSSSYHNTNKNGGSNGEYYHGYDDHNATNTNNNNNNDMTITPTSLNIQNDHNSIVKVSSWKLSSIIATARRYHGLKDSALELFFHEYSNITGSSSGGSGSVVSSGSGRSSSSIIGDDGTKNHHEHSSSLLIAFESRKDREKVMALLPKVRYISNTAAATTTNGYVHDNDGVMNGNLNDPDDIPQAYEYNTSYNDNDDDDPMNNLDPKLIMKKKIPVKIYCHTDTSFLKQIMKLWMKGRLSNFDYLLALNSAAGRSFHDLSRYPVFPWVLKDYDSDVLPLLAFQDDSNKDKKNSFASSSSFFRDLKKPIGALNEDRLYQFKERWKSMQDMEDVASFLYGTHYSAPGYCLYYLVRLMPEHMLCLQNGECFSIHFCLLTFLDIGIMYVVIAKISVDVLVMMITIGKYDAPDRLFHSIRHCYSSLLTNPAGEHFHCIFELLKLYFRKV